MRIRDHRPRDCLDLRALDLIEPAAHQADQVEHVAELIRWLVRLNREQEGVKGIDRMTGSGGKVKISSTQGSDHAAIFRLRIEYDPANASRVAAEHDGCSRVTLAGAGMRQDRDVGIAESTLVEGIEDAEAPSLFVVAPVMAVRIRQVLLQPGHHRGDGARVQNKFAAEHIHAERPGRDQALTHFKEGLHRLQHHAAAASA